ncbi:hypothetical protein [Rhizobium sp. SL42]|uniref:hypothetical protein n=1 Tax=Rhizobium sp. SL42 TaxID=2806346 RepID=UPI001F24B8E9|nr:hypothetical protein [Rhizobium sp. SL42]UJW77055.1 hypothetical protein IM739_21440 [Rhizobium sp. SL42]
MTDITMTARPQRRILWRIWLTLPFARRRKPLVDLDTFSDHLLRDIAMTRDPIDRMAIRFLQDASAVRAARGRKQ